MARYPKVRQQHIAVFGEAGSGKTVLVSSFYGPSQEGSYRNDLWDLVALQTGQGHRLYQNFLGMRDSGTVPLPTRFTNTTYEFAVKLKQDGEDDDEVRRRPFDELRLAWHDYPGEWFTQDPSSAEERIRRTDTFLSLLRSDVALLLVDGQKLLEYQGEEERYLKSLFGNFRQNLVRLKDDLLTDGRLIEFPRIWIVALSKADLVPDWDVDTFRDLVILKAAEDVGRLRSAIADLIDTPDALSIGEDFVLLSSAKFEVKPEDLSPAEIDLTQRIGLDLVLPIASMLPLERRVLWEQRMTVPRQVLDSLADGAEVIAAALTGAKFAGVEKLLARVSRSSRQTQFVAKALPFLAAAVKVAGPRLREMNAQARAQHDHLRATLTQFKIDLETGESGRVIRTQK